MQVSVISDIRYWGNHSENNIIIIMLTQQIGLFSYSSELVQHVFGEEGDLAGVNHINHTVNLVVQSHIMIIARSVTLERSRRTELKNK